MKIRKSVPEKMYLILLVFILSFASVGCEKETDSQVKENTRKESRVENKVLSEEGGEQEESKLDSQTTSELKEEPSKTVNKENKEEFETGKHNRENKVYQNQKYIKKSVNNKSGITRKANKKYNKVMLDGTIKLLTYDEILKLQNIKDPNPGAFREADKYAVFVLNNAKDMNIYAGGSPDAVRQRGKVSMVSLGDGSKLKSYDGKNVKILIQNDRNFHWPGDTMLPLNQPSAGKYRILSVNQKNINHKNSNKKHKKNKNYVIDRNNRSNLQYKKVR